jgi:hypothetical protein
MTLEEYISFFFSPFFFILFFSTDGSQPMPRCLDVEQIASIEASRAPMKR